MSWAFNTQRQCLPRRCGERPQRCSDTCASLCVFAWPLPLRLADAMLGLPNGDAGVYVWNLWVFRHEIVANHRLPFLTSEILALSPPVPLALHNYTTFANVLAFPLIPLLGVVKTFNVLVLASGVMSGYAMYFYARKRTGDAMAAWIGGLLFGFSPFMSARAAEHFSLTLAAPLPDLRLADVPAVLAADDGACVRGWRDGGVGLSLRRLLRRVLPAVGRIHGLLHDGQRRDAAGDGEAHLAARARRPGDRVPGRPHRRHPAPWRRSGGRPRHPRQLHAAVHARADVDADDCRSRLDGGCRSPAPGKRAAVPVACADGRRRAAGLRGDSFSRPVRHGVELRPAELAQSGGLVAEQRARGRPAGLLRAQSPAPVVRLALVRVGVGTARGIQRERRVGAVGRARDDYRRRALGGIPSDQGLGRSSRASSRGWRSGRSSPSRSSSRTCPRPGRCCATCRSSVRHERRRASRSS